MAVCHLLDDVTLIYVYLENYIWNCYSFIYHYAANFVDLSMSKYVPTTFILDK